MERLEHDAFGDIAVDDARLWGAQTQRALQHFTSSGERMPAALIQALARVKAACAEVNRDLGLLPADKAAALIAAAEEIAAGGHAGEFPLPLWQSGSGTQSHMNLNEVLANRASELLGGPRGRGRRIHPNDDANLGQSTNDVFPSAMHLAAASALVSRLQPALTRLSETIDAQAAAFAGIVKIGRTHLQDATPLTLGQEFSGYAAQLRLAATAVAAALPALYPLAVGGTAVGTGLNTHPEFGERVAVVLARRTGLPFVGTANKFAALAGHEPLLAAHGALRTLAAALNKIANDLRWLASGPRSGLGELTLPENEPGSSIMPGKVNPTQCEALTMRCCQVFGNDVTIAFAGASGQFELNVFKPVIAHAFLQSVDLLADGMDDFERHCVRGIAPRPERIAELLERSLMLVTALVPHIGYDRAAEIARHAAATGGTLREAALALGHVNAEQYDAWIDPGAMTGPR